MRVKRVHTGFMSTRPTPLQLIASALAELDAQEARDAALAHVRGKGPGALLAALDFAENAPTVVRVMREDAVSARARRLAGKAQVG